MNKKIIFCLLLCLASAILKAQAPNTWVQKADIGATLPNSAERRQEAAGFAIGGKGYIGLGYSQYTSLFLSDVWQYDTLSKTWSQVADFPAIGRRGPIGVGVGNKGYIIGGMRNGQFGPDNDIWQYDPAANTWTQKTSPNGPGRYWAMAFTLGQKIFIGGGWGLSGPMNDFWEYNIPTDSWTQRDTIPGDKRFSGAGFAAGGKGYIGMGVSQTADLMDLNEWDTTTLTWTPKANFPLTGGITGCTSFGIGDKGYVGMGMVSVGNGYTSNFWEFNPATNSWTQKASYGGGINWGASNFVIGDRGYVAGGFDGSYWSTNMWSYAPTSNTWRHEANFGPQHLRTGSFGFSIGEKGYIGSGFDMYHLVDVWEYDSQTGTWSQKADFTGTGRDAAVGFSIGNKGYVGTGKDGNGGTSDFLQYDQATNSWTQKASFPGDPRTDAVGFSIGNKGYIGTGTYPFSGNYNGLTNDFWEYNPATDAWTQKANFGGGLRANAIGFASNGRGYVGLGSPDYGLTALDFWEYNPTTNSWTQKANFPGNARTSASSFAIGNKGYVVSGVPYIFQPALDDVWRYNTYTDTWTQLDTFAGQPRKGTAVFTIGNKGYIGGGTSQISGTILGDFWQFTSDYYIHTDTVTGPYCIGSSVTVPFTINGSFFAGNVFTAQLSDASGSFANPVNIGTFSDTVAGNISCTLPTNIPSGNGYKIRVVSSSPIIYGSDNNPGFTINGIAPIVNINTTPGNTICEGTTVLFKANVVGGGTFPAYVWKKNGTTVGTDSTYTSYTLSNNDQLTCTVTSSALCASTPTTSAPVTMIVNPVITSTVTISATPGDTICAGSLITYTANVQNAGTNPVYLWQVNGIGVSNAPTYSSNSFSNNDKIVCQITPNVACPFTPNTFSNLDSVTVYLQPSVNITASGPTSFCAGDSVMLNGNMQTGVDYLWLRNNVPTIVTTPENTAHTDGNYELTATTVHGCSDTSNAIQVTVKPMPDITLLITGDTTFCEGGSVKIEVASTAPGNTYLWFNLGSAINNTSAQYIASTSGVYSVRAANNQNCVDTSRQVTVVENPKPQPIITISNGSLTTGTYSSYQWSLNQTPISGATNASYNPNGNPGTYTVTVFDNNGCSNTSAPYGVSTGVSNINQANGIVVSPIPTHGILQITTQQEIRIDLFDISGKTILSNIRSHMIDITELPAGVYILKIKDTENNLLRVERVVKQ
ncbi:Kelch repeat-containing protein [Taibaiella soli]|uniref:Ig-like domain-containing protein n=1 Tax=Taibaiella soli TaxID=1649169 RepID=A0A2W2AB86_9BACT|nr:T9SS type A sorting domain-containing protein [Taibaiella soli]PZF72675.1 hypothetical protein DN068_12480 [Taibaiella soli]